MAAARTFPFRGFSPGLWLAPELDGIIQFCERYRRLPDSETQTYTASEYPHQAMPLEVLMRSGVEEVGLLWASQHGKTVTLENALFGWSCRAPGTTIWAVPDQKLKDRYGRRLRNAVMATPRWRDELEPGARSISKESIRFRRMDMFYAIGGSEADMSSTPARYVVIDEIDKFPLSTKKEGSPRSQLKKRQRTFHDRKMLVSSTPTTIDGEIWKFAMSSQLWESCTQCPGCRQWHPWYWGAVRWDKRPEGRSYRRHGELVRAGKVDVWYECPRCGEKYSEAKMREAEKGLEYRVCSVEINAAMSYEERFDMLMRQGEEGVPEVRWDVPEKINWRVCFHKGAIVTARTPLRQLVQEWHDGLEARQDGDESGIQDFFIHHLALPFSRRTIRHTEREVTDRVVEYAAGVVPADTVLLSCGIDVQQDGFFLVWLAFNKKGRVHVCKHERVWGDFPQLRTALSDPLKMEGFPQGVFAQLHLIDASDGMVARSVTAFCEEFAADRFRPCKGSAAPLGGGRIWSPVKTEASALGDRGIMVSSTAARDWWASQFKVSVGEPEGGVTFHQGVLLDTEFQRQMVSEQRVDDRGKIIWIRRKGYRANHYWDAIIYAAVAGIVLGAAKLKQHEPAPGQDSVVIKTQDFEMDR